MRKPFVIGFGRLKRRIRGEARRPHRALGLQRFLAVRGRFERRDLAQQGFIVIFRETKDTWGR